MIALSFLGTTDYKETTYTLGDRRHQTRFFSAALPHFFALDRLLVVMTDEARQKHGEALATLCDHEPVMVPSGKDESELWTMFQALADAVPADSELILDVTHGYRSQPILGLAAAVYLQAAKGVTLQGIYYGAWEARDTTRNVTPVFDLTPFLQLMDWASASRFFLRSGDATALSHLLEETQNRTYRVPDSVYRARGLSKMGKHLRNLTRALALAQPLAAVQTAKHLPYAMEILKNDLEQLPQSRPFAELLDAVRDRFQPMVEADGRLFTPKGFRAQAEMIRFHLKTDQLQQALTLCREALVSRVCAALTGVMDEASLLDRQNREEAQNLLNDLAKRDEDHLLDPGSPEKRLASVWARLRDLRNHVNHAGMRKEQMKLDTLYDNARKLCEEVAHLLTAGPEAFPLNSPPAS
jgi:CRISPR-associated DxTHG motif protein